MALYTGRVDDGIIHRNRGLIRYLTISRLSESDKFGNKPREDLWKHDKFDLFDVWYPKVAPDGKDVYAWYNGQLGWEGFSIRYLKKITSDENFPFLLDLSKRIVEADLESEGKKGVVLQCVCTDVEHCHRKLLADYIKGLIKNRHGYGIRLKHI